MTSDTTIVSDLVSQNINIFLRNVVKATGVIFFMFSLSWKLSLVTFMGFPIIMLVSDVYGKYYKVGRSGWRGRGVLHYWAVPLLKASWRLWVALELVGLMLGCFAAGSGGRKAALNLYGQMSAASAVTLLHAQESKHLRSDRRGSLVTGCPICACLNSCNLSSPLPLG